MCPDPLQQHEQNSEIARSSNTTWDDMDTTVKSGCPKRSFGSMTSVEEPGSWDHTHVLEVSGFYEIPSQPRPITNKSCRGRNEKRFCWISHVACGD